MTRVALITGGAGGMGRAIAERFLRHGDAVVLADVDAAGLRAAATAMPDVATVEADLTLVAECARMVGGVPRFGRCDAHHWGLRPGGVGRLGGLLSRGPCRSGAEALLG